MLSGLAPPLPPDSETMSSPHSVTPVSYTHLDVYKRQVPAKGQAAQQPTATPGVNPQTGDNSNASVWAAMLSLAAIGAAGTACAAYRKRKAQ